MTAAASPGSRQVTASIAQAASGTATDQAGRPPNIRPSSPCPHPLSYQVRDRLARCRPKAYPTQIPAALADASNLVDVLSISALGGLDLFHYPGVRSDSGGDGLGADKNVPLREPTGDEVLQFAAPAHLQPAARPL